MRTRKARTSGKRIFLSMLVSATMAISMIPVSSFAFAAQSTDSTQNSSANASASTQAGNAENAATANEQNISATTPTNEAKAETATQAPKDTSAADANAPAAEPIASIGETTFTTLKAAIAQAKPGETIKLLKDVNLTGSGTLQIDGITLDLDGHTISAKNYSLVFEGSNSTIENGSFDSLGGAYGLFYGDSTTSSNVMLKNLKIKGGVNIFNSGGVVLKDVNADASASNSPYYAIWCDVNAQAAVEGGSYKSNGAAVLGLTDNSSGAPASKLMIDSGTFTSDRSPLVLKGANRYTPEINGGTFFNVDETKAYLSEDHCLMPKGNGQYAVTAKTQDVSNADETVVPDEYELISTNLSNEKASHMGEALNRPEVAQAISEAGGTERMWTVDVILRNKSTLAEDHDTETTFMLAYPPDVDTSKLNDYKFVVVHLKEADQNGETTFEPEVKSDDKVQATPQGLKVTSTLSPFAISYSTAQDHSTHSDTPTSPDEGGSSVEQATTPTTPTDDRAAGAHAKLADRPSSVAKSGSAPTSASQATGVTSAQSDGAQAASFDIPRIHTGLELGNIPVKQSPLSSIPWPIWVLIGLAVGCGVAGIALLATSRKKNERS